MFSVPVMKTQMGRPVTALQKKMQVKRKVMTQSSGLKQTIPLENMENFAYVGPVMFGSTEPMQGNTSSGFVYDTGSGFLTVQSTECSTCPDEYYDMSASPGAAFGCTGNDAQYSSTS